MRIITFVIGLIFSLVLVAPSDVVAGTHVTVYFAGGFVIGGVAVFYSVLIGGDRRHSKNEKKNEENLNSLAEKYALNTRSVQHTEEDISQSGMVKVLEW
ncbi:MAG: hypothetical protein HY755_06095 [Nitrospirae bacterium]|nr:hypothetical protein [Nitrospirota bacterium]